MRPERISANGILTPDSLFKGMTDSGVNPQISSSLYSHEKAHADADQERRGEFGFIVSSGWIVAYYLIQGERTPEQLMEIASAPGMSRMSEQDWNIYNSAWRDLVKEVQEKKFEEESKPQSYKNLRNLLIESISKKLDRMTDEGKFPKLEQILDYEFVDLLRDFGGVIHTAYQEAVEYVKGSKLNQNDQAETYKQQPSSYYLSPVDI